MHFFVCQKSAFFPQVDAAMPCLKSLLTKYHNIEEHLNCERLPWEGVGQMLNSILRRILTRTLPDVNPIKLKIL